MATTTTTTTINSAKAAEAAIAAALQDKFAAHIKGGKDAVLLPVIAHGMARAYWRVLRDAWAAGGDGKYIAAERLVAAIEAGKLPPACTEKGCRLAVEAAGFDWPPKRGEKAAQATRVLEL